MKHNRVPIKFTAVLLCAALVLPLFASCSVSLTDPEPALLANISITPQKADDAGVAYDSGFLITADVPLTQRELEKGLVVEPEIDYALSATAAGFILKPAEPLAPNAVYAFTLGTQEGRTRTWAFQSRRPFSILSASPADDATDVNIYSSVEFKMTHTGVDLIGNFEVTPPIDFNVSSSGRTAYLYPVESFKPNTRYTVTVKKGLESPLGDILAEDYNLTFTTGSTSDNSYRRNDGVPLYLYGEYGETFLPGDTPVIRIGANNQSPDGKGVLPVDLSVSVYEFGGSERYMQALSGYDTYIEQGGDVDSYRCDEDALTHVVSFETQMYMSEDYYTGYGYVILPESLPKGWYAVNITTTTPKGVECTIQKLLQVSDVAVYSESVNGQTLVWLNDAAGGETITGASVGLFEAGKANPSMSMTTDQSGLALFDTNEMESGYLFAKVDTDNEYVGRLPLAAEKEPDPCELFYSFAYKDREIYLPSDTVHLWGRLAPRKSGVTLPAELKLELVSISSDSDEVILEAPVLLEANGRFSAELTYDSLTTSESYYLRVVDEADVQYYETYLHVYEYEKPLYKLSTTNEQVFYTADEVVDFTLSAGFYNGTPVPNLPFNASWDNGNTELLTDLSGLATLRLNENKHYFDQVTAWQPYNLYVYMESTGMEDQYLGTSASALVFPRDTMLQTERSTDGFQNEITVKTNRIDTSNVESAQDVWKNFPQGITGGAVNIPVDVSIYRVDHIKELSDTYYDPVNKKSVPEYRYTKQETLERRYTVSTVNGEAVLANLPNPTESEQYYRIELTCKDTAGRTITQSEYLNYYEDLYYSSESLYYRFANQKVESASNSAYQYYSGYTATYALGERVGIQLLENSLEPVDAQGNTLYTLVQDGILDSGVVPATSFSFTQNERYLPNLTVVGAYFDGRHIYPVSSCSVLYDPAEHELSLSVTPDRNTYRPGDKVSLDVAVTDASGAPVSTDISVSVVDEAVFALAGQNIDPLGTLYQSVYSYTLAAFTSYNQYAFDRFNDGGGKGGGGGGMETGGGDMPRGQFKDTAAVLSATTDQDGRAALSFTLPDNLTSWRITGVTVTDDLCAGTARTNINTTIPLFVSPVYNTTYVEGDDIAFTARAYGDKVTNDTEVAFTTTVTTGKRKKEEQTLTLPAGEFAQFDFGKLAAGDYTVLFGAQADGESDAVEHSFTVKKSALEMPLSRGVTQGEVSGLRAEKYPVWLGFYDSQYAEYIQTLEHLAGQYGSRADQQTAYAVAAGLLKQFADDDEILTTLQSSDAITADFADYQRSSGGVCLHSYDYPDVQLTARAAVAAPELFNTETMVSYLDEVVNTGWYELTNTCAAIMGLAALRQPVLTDAKAMLKNASALSDIGILYLTLALAYLGDTDGARAAYDTYIAPHIVTGEQWSYYDVPAVSDDGEIIYTEDGSVMKADTGKGDYDRFDDALTLTGAKLERTALVMLLAQQTGLADTDALLRYVRDNSSYDVSTLSEQTAYVNHFVPAYTDTAVVSYNRGLFPTTLELKKGGIRYIPFNKNQLAKSNVTVKNGDVGILASYTGTPDSLAKDPSPEITVSKSIRKQDAGPLDAGDLALVSITVTFGGDAPTGQYDIAEWVPSSLRFQSAFYPGYGTNGIWLDSQEGQRLTMSLYYSGNDTIPTDGPPTQNNTYTIAYYARCVTDGDSRVDSTYVIHRPSGAMNFTEQATLSLGDAFKPIDLTSK